MGDELTLIEGLTAKQVETLTVAVECNDRQAVGDHRVLRALERRNLLAAMMDGGYTLTDLGRYQVRWYVEDAARHWDVRPDSFGHYVRIGRAPAPDGFEHPGGTVARAYWKPSTITDYERGPGRGNFERIEIDMSTVIRQYRAGVSIRAIAKSLGVSATTLTNRLEEAGEKEVTSSSRTAYRHDQRASISAEGAG